MIGVKISYDKGFQGGIHGVFFLVFLFLFLLFFFFLSKPGGYGISDIT